MRLLMLLVLGFVALLGVTFASLNAESVVVHYYIGIQKIPLSALVVGVLVLGVLIGLLASFPVILQLKMKLRRLSRQKMEH